VLSCESGIQRKTCFAAARATASIIAAQSCGAGHGIGDSPHCCRLDFGTLGSSTLEQKKPEPYLTAPQAGMLIDPKWVSLAERVIRGEKVKHIAESMGVRPSSVRIRVLKVFKRRNANKYRELSQMRDYGCTTEPSIRILVKHCREFGFGEAT
jgi:hypothetical protein